MKVVKKVSNSRTPWISHGRGALFLLGSHECHFDTRVGVRQIYGTFPLTKGLGHYGIRDRHVLAEIPHHEFRVAHQTNGIRAQNGHPATGITLDPLCVHH